MSASEGPTVTVTMVPPQEAALPPPELRGDAGAGGEGDGKGGKHGDSSNKNNNVGKLFVGAIPKTATAQTLEDFFSTWGVVKEVIMKYNEDGTTKGFAFVVFEDPGLLPIIIKASQDGETKIDDKWIDCKDANSGGHGGKGGPKGGCCSGGAWELLKGSRGNWGMGKGWDAGKGWGLPGKGMWDNWGGCGGGWGWDAWGMSGKGWDAGWGWDGGKGGWDAGKGWDGGKGGWGGGCKGAWDGGKGKGWAPGFNDGKGWGGGKGPDKGGKGWGGGGAKGWDGGKGGKGPKGPSTGLNEGRVFVGGLPRVVDEVLLKEYFGTFGEVESLMMKYDDMGIPRGFCFVQYKDPEVAHRVVTESQAGTTVFDGKWVDCKDPNGTTVNGKGGEGKGSPDGPFDAKRQRLDEGGSWGKGGKEGHVDPNKLFVGGLPRNTTDSAMMDVFTQYGVVREVELKYDVELGTFRGFGFVTFEDPKVAQDLILKGNVDFEGKPVTVSSPAAKGQGKGFY